MSVTSQPVSITSYSLLKGRLYKVGVLAIVVVPFMSIPVAFWQLWHTIAGLFDVLLLIGTFLPIALGITVGYHRHFTHRSFQAKPWVRAVLGIFGLMAIEGKIITRVADHRMHQQFSDQEEDLHSPMKSLFHAHIGWFFQSDAADPHEYAKDLLRDPLVVALDRQAPWWYVVSLVTPFLLGGFQGLLWAGLVRIFLVHHFTWSINSICHTFGDRPYKTPTQDRSGNVPWLLLSLGENYHNTHHAVPWSARHGTTLLNDPSFACILLLQRLGLAWDIRVPSEERLRSVLAEEGM